MEEAAARSLRVTLRYFDGCPHWRTLYDRLHQVLREEGLLDVELVSLQSLPAGRASCAFIRHTRQDTLKSVCRSEP